MLSCSEDDDLFKIVDLFFQNTFRRLPVLSGEQVVGLISRIHVLQGSIKLWETERETAAGSQPDSGYLTDQLKAALKGYHRASRADVYNSPGWKRLQARSGHRPMSQPSEARNMTIDSTAISAHAVGDRVFHQKFGYGTITGIEGDKLDIAFEKAGDKKVVAKFVTAAAGAGVDDVPF